MASPPAASQSGVCPVYVQGRFTHLAKKGCSHHLKRVEVDLRSFLEDSDHFLSFLATLTAHMRLVEGQWLQPGVPSSELENGPRKH